nr:potassium channel family protein [uncultured Desulfuromonas sp.]
MKTNNSAIRQLRIYLLLFIAVICLSTLCFMFTEHLSFSDALYFSIVTMSSVGYGDILPKTEQGRLFAMVFIILGAVTFLSLIGRATELMLNRRDEESKRRKLHMLVGVFFNEIGQGLLRQLVEHMPLAASERQRFEFTAQWTARDFRALNDYAASLPFSLERTADLLGSCGSTLTTVKPLLIRLLENPAVLEHSAFSELLLALFHFEQELGYRQGFTDLPESDVNHLQNDAIRVYRLLLPQWFDYLEHLQRDYPYLYSLQVRVNPFRMTPSALVS